MLGWIYLIFQRLLGVIYPERCIFCDEVLSLENRSMGMCDSCEVDDMLYPEGLNNEEVTAVFKYGGMIRDMLHRFKFSFRPEYAEGISRLMLSYLRDFEFSEYDMLVPVPMHSVKRRKRGFNQAELMAVEMGRLLDMPACTNELVRVKNTVAQIELGGKQRRENVRNAFSVKNNSVFKGKRIIIIDDIYTTGSTVGECRKCLLDAGADKVKVICFSRRY